MPLAKYLLQRYADGKLTPELSTDARELLIEHNWPGNIRELDNVMQRAMILRRGNSILPEDLCFEPSRDIQSANSSSTVERSSQANDLGDELKKKENLLIIEALQAGNGNRKYAAMKLGISERTLRYKLARMRDEGVNIPRGYGISIG